MKTNHKIRLLSLYTIFNFTILELLVVISIIMVLVSMILPALNSSRENVRKIQCMSNCRQFGGAIGMYMNDYNGWLPHSGDANYDATDTSIPAGSAVSWKFLIAPYLNSQTTKYALEHGVFNCPSQKSVCNTSAWGYNGFYGGYGWNIANLGWRGSPKEGNWVGWVKMDQISQPSKTLTAGDTSDYYAQDTSLNYTLFYLYNDQLVKIGNRHKKGGDYLWCDGHASWVLASEVYKNPSWFKIQK